VEAVAGIRQERVVAVLRELVDVDALGTSVIEVTMHVEGAFEEIRRLRAREELTVLAGTVRTGPQARAAIEAGAQAIVSPATIGEVAAVCRERDTPWIPGTFTPSEIEAAWDAGAAMVKLFPARLGGPQYVRDVLAVLSDVPLLVTGGVDAANAAAFLEAGAVAVGCDASRTRSVVDAVSLG
jgi:2-dehydro-3-deoxyphosphogluconate aldolase / (4S)-4-hydroxy-2-oxoglutarate aldolase